MIRVADIQREVARHYGLPHRYLREPFPKGKRGINTYSVSHPRQVAMRLSTLLTEHSLTRIGHFFGGRDRKTVYHAGKAVAERVKSDPDLHETMRAITLSLVRR